MSTVLSSSPVVARAGPNTTALSGVHARAGGTIQSLKSLPRTATRRSRGHLTVQANELNKWAGRSFDDQCEPNPFDEETAKVLLRVLTARSVKKLLTQLQELDLHQAQWFNNYAAENPPTEGDKFITELFNAKGVVVMDSANNTSHHIDPQNLAHRLLQIRIDMARRTTLDLPGFTERHNTDVLRSHLTRNTFVSGSNDAGYKERRGYFRPNGKR